MRPVHCLRFLAYLLLATAASSLPASASGGTDWPQLLGPTRDGVYAGTDLAKSWPAEGPRVLWQKKVGQGFSGPAVAAGKLIIFHRLGDKETVEAIDANTGKNRWS